MKCPKEITNEDIVNNLSDNDIEFNLASCEQNCDNYYHNCQLVELMCNRLKEYTFKNVCCS